MFRAFDLASESWPFARWPRNAGRAIAARIPMIRITTRSSIRVKPRSDSMRSRIFRSILITPWLVGFAIQVLTEVGLPGVGGLAATLGRARGGRGARTSRDPVTALRDREEVARLRGSHDRVGVGGETWHLNLAGLRCGAADRQAGP